MILPPLVTLGHRGRSYPNGRANENLRQIPYPAAVADYIVYSNQLYPPIHLREIARIVQLFLGIQDSIERNCVSHAQHQKTEAYTKSMLCCTPPMKQPVSPHRILLTWLS
jgi:hypothetical protein